jgi:hypothetical protein
MTSTRLFAIVLVIVAARTCVAVTFIGAAGDGKTSIYYDPLTGEMGIEPDGLSVGLFSHVKLCRRSRIFRFVWRLLLCLHAL